MHLPPTTHSSRLLMSSKLCLRDDGWEIRNFHNVARALPLPCGALKLSARRPPLSISPPSCLHAEKEARSYHVNEAQEDRLVPNGASRAAQSPWDAVGAGRRLVDNPSKRLDISSAEQTATRISHPAFALVKLAFFEKAVRLSSRTRVLAPAPFSLLPRFGPSRTRSIFRDPPIRRRQALFVQ